MIEFDGVLDDILGRPDSDLIVFAIEQLSQNINRLGDIAIDAGNPIGECFVLGLLECCFECGLLQPDVNARRGTACLATSLVDGVCEKTRY